MEMRGVLIAHRATEFSDSWLQSIPQTRAAKTFALRRATAASHGSRARRPAYLRVCFQSSPRSHKDKSPTTVARRVCS